MAKNEDLSQLLLERIRRSKSRRMEIARKYRSGEFSELADLNKTLDRLRSRGHNRAAQLYSRIKGSAATRDISSNQESSLTESTIQAANRIVHESLIGVDNTQSVQFLHRGSSAALSVGRIVTLPHRGANGTGFLISPRLMMTNHHVLASTLDAEENMVEFEYGDVPEAPALAFRFAPAEFFLTSPVEEFDCTVVAVEPVNNDGIPLARFGVAKLGGHENALQVGERVNIIHHPAGGLKQVSIRDNFVADEYPEIDPVYWLYASDTERGSSGSPVFDENWQVVALHHAGVAVDDPEEVNAYRQILQSLGVAGIGDSNTIELNEGIRIDRIMSWMREQARLLTPEQHSLYDEIFLTHGSPRVPQFPTEANTIVHLPDQCAPGESTSSITMNFYVGGRLQSSSSPSRVKDDPNTIDRRTLELFQSTVNAVSYTHLTLPTKA